MRDASAALNREKKRRGMEGDLPINHANIKLTSAFCFVVQETSAQLVAELFRCHSKPKPMK